MKSDRDTVIDIRVERLRRSMVDHMEAIAARLEADARNAMEPALDQFIAAVERLHRPPKLLKRTKIALKAHLFDVVRAVVNDSEVAQRVANRRKKPENPDSVST